MPLAAFLQDAYSALALRQLSADRNAEVLAQLAVELDAVVNQIGLDYGGKLVKALGKNGTAKLQQRLAQLDSGSNDAVLYRGVTSKYRAVAGNASYEQQGEERAAAVKAAYPGPQRQPTKSLLRLLVYATADEEQFKAEVQKLSKSCGAKVKLATIKGSSLKGILRLMEKGILKAIINGWDAVDFSDIRDVLRAMLVCGNNGTSFADDTAIAVKAQAAVYGSEVLSARRSKFRLGGDSVTEWRDELVNPLLTSGKHRLLAEIQIVRSRMLIQRESMGGHDGYDESRGLRGLYDACVASGLGASSSGDADKKLGALIAKRDAHVAAAKKLTLQIEAAVPDPDVAVASLTSGDGLSGGADFEHLSAVSSSMPGGDSEKEKKKEKKKTAKEESAGFGDDDGADSSAGVQKEVAALKKRVAALEKENAALKKKKGGSSDAGVDFADAAPQNGSAAAESGEIVFIDAGEDEAVQAGAVDEKAGCCAIV